MQYINLTKNGHLVNHLYKSHANYCNALTTNWHLKGIKNSLRPVVTTQKKRPLATLLVRRWSNHDFKACRARCGTALTVTASQEFTFWPLVSIFK